MFRSKRKAGDFDAEIEAHIELERERLREEGLSDEDARVAAHRAFGNVTRAQERFFESGHWLWWDHLWRDIRYAIRMLRHSPGFTAVAALTIALGIGATTAIFSVVDATLIHPLPFPEPAQLVAIQDDLPGVGSYDVGMSEPEWWDLRRSGVFENISPAWYDDNNLTGATAPARVGILIVAPNYFALLGVKPELGSTFNIEDPTPGLILQCVISDGLWKRAFASDPNILNRSLRLDNDVYRIIGVMPPGFHATYHTIQERNVEVWIAGGFAATPFSEPPRRSSHFPGAIARIKYGLTLAEAQKKIDALVASVQKEFPVDYPAQSAWRVRLVPLKETIVGNVRSSLLVLLAGVALVLLIGCVNVANLLLARAEARTREIAVRQALGAARARLSQQLLTESLLLSLLGGAIGLVILLFSKPLLLRLIPDSLPRLNEISVSWGIWLFTFATSLVTGLIFGLAPALQSSRLDLIQALKREGRSTTTSGQQARTRRLLVVSEFALSVVLMITATLLLRSFRDLLNVQLGFNPQNVMMVRTRLPYPNDPSTDVYRTVSQKAPFFREVLHRARTLPGVEEAALGDSTSVPLNHRQRDLTLFPMIREGSGNEGNHVPFVNGSIVTPEYFHLMGMALLRGRLFCDRDNDKAPEVAVINEAMAQAYWPGEDPLGKRVKLSQVPSTPWTTIVGIVGNARTESLENATIPQLYASLYQKNEKHLAIFLRGNLDAAAIPEEVRAQVQSVNPEIPVFGAESLNQVLSDSLSVRRFSMEMIAAFALTALLLAAIGIYGVISYIVSERTHEIGIRLALGARRRSIFQMILRQGLILAVCGAAIGLACALVVCHLIQGLLYGVRPADPVTFVGVLILLIGVALFACYMPARRAVRVDPMIALRHE